ncbi:hypothetical protein LM594_03970 [Candidatus Caldipriscus sp.]|nr:hypothetical protein [Candidatus Caldipriscus sp.]
MVLRIDSVGNCLFYQTNTRWGYIAVGFILWTFPDYDFLVLKIGSDGSLQWAKAYG